MENKDQSVAACESLLQETNRRWTVYGSQDCGLKYKRRCAKGVTGSYSRPAPLEARFSYADNALSWRLQKMLEHADADQIKWFSTYYETEFPFTRSPWLHCIEAKKTKGYKQKGSGFWRGLNDMFQACRWQSLSTERLRLRSRTTQTHTQRHHK